MDEHIWEVAQLSATLVKDLMEEMGVTRPTALILAHRGLAPDTAADFLNPLLQQLSDPFALPGTRTAAERLWQAIHRGERVLVHGDYDTDGITAAVLLSGVLRQNGAEVASFLPHRIEDGYGLTPDAIEKATREGFGVLVTVDCGITSFDAARAARERGVSLLITDHHVPAAEIPAAHAVVNPKLGSASLGCENLAGVGVAFKLCHAFLKYGREQQLGGYSTDLRRELDLVALGTVADIVPLFAENRILVRYGLGVLSGQQRPGIHALCQLAGIDEVVRTSDITYKLAPRLNASGRMGDPNDSLRLLESSSMPQAVALARALEEHNQLRQQIEEETTQQAEAQITERCRLEKDRSIVVWAPNWHQGVVGIVASRLARRHHRPCVVLTRDANSQLIGSARSVQRLDLVGILQKCSHTLTRFGGHAMAAGLSLPTENLAAFCASFQQAVEHTSASDAMRPSLDICGHVSLAEITETFFGEVECIEPFGHGNPEPVFMTHGVQPERVLNAGANHSRGMLRDHSGTAIAFIAFGRTPDSLPPPPWTMVYTPQINRFQGRCIPQVRVEAIETDRSQ